MALSLQKQRLNPVTARSKNYVAKNVISQKKRRKATPTCPPWLRSPRQSRGDGVCLFPRYQAVANARSIRGIRAIRGQFAKSSSSLCQFPIRAIHVIRGRAAWASDAPRRRGRFAAPGRTAGTRKTRRLLHAPHCRATLQTPRARPMTIAQNQGLLQLLGGTPIRPAKLQKPPVSYLSPLAPRLSPLLSSI
jgi:hypothetical protein